LRFVSAHAMVSSLGRIRLRFSGSWLVMAKFRLALIGTCAALALAVAPVAPASARPFHHGGLFFGVAALGAAAVVAAATIVTAPVRVLAAPIYAPAPAYYPPPAPAYYAPAPAYYAPAPAYYPPPAYGYYGR
jgi:hypothetical protein